MARPNSPPRPGSGPPRPGTGKARPTAKHRPPPPKAAPKAQGGWSPANAGDPDEIVVSPAPARPAAAKHLKMVPLSGRSEGTYDDGHDMGSGAFARPAPQGPPVSAPGPMPVMGPAMGQPMGIQGPVAAGMPMGGMPMGAPAMGGYPGNPAMMGANPYEDPRGTSNRVFMVIIGLVLVVCGSILVTGALMMVVVVQKMTPEPLQPLESPTVVAAPPQIGEGVDTGSGREKPVEKPDPRPKPTRPRPDPGPASPKPAGTSTAPPPPAPMPAGTPGQVSVTLPSGLRASSFEVVCEAAGYRKRAVFMGASSASLGDVPTAACSMILKGVGTGKAFRFTSVPRAFNCSGVGSNISCR